VSGVRAWTICGEVASGADTLQKARELQPDLVLLDVNLPDANGLEIARRLRAEFTQIRILVISQHDRETLLPRAMEAGANGCLDKGRLGIDLLSTIERMR
jgi:DNA-binding NarL/FixJ family response regulator